jgi:hypothetical protein
VGLYEKLVVVAALDQVAIAVIFFINAGINMAGSVTATFIKCL